MRTLTRRFATLGAHKIGRVGLSSLSTAFGALLLTTALGGGEAEAKTPGKTYCFHGKCHRVKTIADTEAMIGQEETVSASFYDSCKRDRYNPCGLTSSGEVFRADAADNAASPTYPDGTTLLVWSPVTQASVVLRVNNAGPYWGGRKLDVSRGAADKLGFSGQGVATLKIRVLDAPTAAEAAYKKGRKYDPLPGYIGKFASLDEAHAGVAAGFAVAGLTLPPDLAGTSGTAVAQAGITADGAVQLASLAASDVVQAVSAPAEIAPVKVSVAVAAMEQPGAETAVERQPVRRAVAETQSRAERTASRNSRSYRVAAKQQKREAVRTKPVEVATLEREPQRKSRIVTLDGTNDMSVFARHTHAGMDRIAPQEPMGRRAYSALGRSPRDGNDG